MEKLHRSEEYSLPSTNNSVQNSNGLAISGSSDPEYFHFRSSKSLIQVLNTSNYLKSLILNFKLNYVVQHLLEFFARY